MKAKTYRKPRPFVGLLKRRVSPSMPRECFWSSTRAQDTSLTGRYNYIYGPFKTVRGAKWCQMFGPTPMAETVPEMERAAEAFEKLKQNSKGVEERHGKHKGVRARGRSRATQPG